MFNKEKTLSKGFLIAVFTLILNDFYLKQQFSNFFTGKLSDFAGLFAFPFFFSALFPRGKKWIYLVTGLGFILWKLPCTDVLISIWNEYIPYSIGRAIDYSDYIALLILPISYKYSPNKHLMYNNYLKKVLKTCIICITLFSFMATAGTHGNIKIYKVNHSKYRIEKAVRELFARHPNLVVPDNYQNLTKPHILGPEGDQEISKLNADSVNFDFYFENEKIIFWSSFVEGEVNWNNKPSYLALEGVLDLTKKKWNYSNDLDKAEQLKLTTFFEKEIMTELNEILETKKK